MCKVVLIRPVVGAQRGLERGHAIIVVSAWTNHFAFASGSVPCSAQPIWPMSRPILVATAALCAGVNIEADDVYPRPCVD
jgi:hypothetical protein